MEIKKSCSKNYDIIPQNQLKSDKTDINNPNDTPILTPNTPPNDDTKTNKEIKQMMTLKTIKN